MPEFTRPSQSNTYYCFTPITQEVRSHVGTAAAAYYLNRAPQSLRVWACYGRGPLTAVRIHGRLAWPVEQIRQLLSGERA